MNFTVIEGTITLYHGGKIFDISNKKHPDVFAEVIKKIKEKDFEALGKFLDDFDPNKVLAGYSDGQISFRNNEVYVGGDWQPVPRVISERIKEFIDLGLPYEPLVRFWKNLRENPNQNSVKQLFSFLKQNKHPITDDGRFVAYKRVKKMDFSTLSVEQREKLGFAIHNGHVYVDSYSQTINNAPGSIVKMDRWEIDPDENRTCSAGLHVAAWEYATSYPGNVLIMVKVNPRDVVAVPTDYSRQKMRVCEYQVIEECEQDLQGVEAVHYSEDDKAPVGEDHEDHRPSNTRFGSDEEDEDDFYGSDDEDEDDFYGSDDEDEDY